MDNCRGHLSPTRAWRGRAASHPPIFMLSAEESCRHAERLRARGGGGFASITTVSPRGLPPHVKGMGRCGGGSTGSGSCWSPGAARCRSEEDRVSGADSDKVGLASPGPSADRSATELPRPCCTPQHQATRRQRRPLHTRLYWWGAPHEPVRCASDRGLSSVAARSRWRSLRLMRHCGRMAPHDHTKTS